MSKYRKTLLFSLYVSFEDKPRIYSKTWPNWFITAYYWVVPLRSCKNSFLSPLRPARALRGAPRGFIQREMFHHSMHIILGHNITQLINILCLKLRRSFFFPKRALGRPWRGARRFFSPRICSSSPCSSF